jgi:hypothetical protein
MLQLIPKKRKNISSKIEIEQRKYVSGSPCIIRHHNDPTRYICVFRLNHFISGGSKTLNAILHLDNHFNMIETKIINYDFQSNRTRDGIEDIRLFRFHQQIYYIGTFKHNDHDQVTSGIFNFLEPNSPEKITENIINITFPSDFIREKNWVFFEYRSQLCIIYRWFPLQICQIDYEKNQLNLIEEKVMPRVFKTLYGSSCGVIYDNLLWFIVHANNNRHYSHMFVVFDTNMNLIKYSELFKFDNHQVEFAYGLCIENGEFIITYSTNDSTSIIVCFDYDYITKRIDWTFV